MNDLTIPASAPTNDLDSLIIPASAPASAPESTSESAGSDKNAVVPPELCIESPTDRLPARPFTEKLPSGTIVEHH
jgi:hypothetical protein